MDRRTDMHDGCSTFKAGCRHNGMVIKRTMACTLSAPVYMRLPGVQSAQLEEEAKRARDELARAQQRSQ